VLRGARIPTEVLLAAEALRTNRPQRSDDAQNDPRGCKLLVLGNTRTILSADEDASPSALSIYNKLGEGSPIATDRHASPTRPRRPSRMRGCMNRAAIRSRRGAIARARAARLGDPELFSVTLSPKPR
jgi:hypothetical protein